MPAEVDRNTSNDTVHPKQEGIESFGDSESRRQDAESPVMPAENLPPIPDTRSPDRSNDSEESTNPPAAEQPADMPLAKATPDDSDPETANAEHAGEDEPELADTPRGEIDVMIRTAAAHVKAMQGKQAVSILKRASGHFKNELRPDFYLGLLHSGVGINDAKTAEFHFRKVLERSPGNIAALNNLALTLAKTRKIAPARNYFALAAKVEPRPIEVDQNLGRLLSQAIPLEIKKEELKKITSMNTRLADYEPNKGWMYMPLDDSPKVIAETMLFCKGGRLEDVSCSYCIGLANMRCGACGGSGKSFRTTSTPQAVRTPVGTVTTDSQSTATVACSRCRGSGRVDCEHCSHGRDPSLR